MAHFKLSIFGSVSELAHIGAALFDAGLGDRNAEAVDGAPERAVRSLPPEAVAPYGVQPDPTPTPVVEVNAADKPKRTRKATQVDQPPAEEGPRTLAEQIKDVVAETRAEEAVKPGPSEGAAAPVEQAAPLADASTATTASPSDVPGLTSACQDLVKKLITKYETQVVLDTLKGFGGMAVSAIAKDAPQNLPALLLKLQELDMAKAS